MPIPIRDDFPTPIDKLKWVMQCLRDPENGCPWDLEQTFESIVKHTIEEAYEVVDAIENGSKDDLHEELGDLLFQVILYAQIASEDGAFDFDSVAQGVADKMLSRHPHVFGDIEVSAANDVNAIWEAQKSKEKKGQNTLDNITLGLPALMRAQKILKKAAKTGFEWPTSEKALEKVHEELTEFQEATSPEDKEEEFGDLLFAMTNYGRMNNIDCEEALRKANEKFITRFKDMAKATHPDLKDLSLDEMLSLWKQVK